MAWVYRNQDGDELTEYKIWERFHNDLNESLPVIEIGVLTFLAGNVLKKVDPIAYHEEFYNYLHFNGWEEVKV